MNKTLGIAGVFTFAGISLCAGQTLAATTYTILTAPNKSAAAYTTAQELAESNDAVSAAPSIGNALKEAHSIASSCGECIINIKMAEGEYVGRGGAVPQWIFAEIEAPKVSLHILGGYDSTYKERAPFTHVTSITKAKGRTGAILEIEAKKSKLKELVVSGLFIDVGDGNSYSGSNLMKGSSCTEPILRFGYLETEKLEISDSVFMNGAHSVAAPLIRAANDKSEVIIRNNIILNNVYAWDVVSPSHRNILNNYIVEGNSFIMNWPYNPDPSTSNPGTLEIGNNYTAKKVIIKDNLFAYNTGGAIFPQWNEERGPKMEIKHNLFYANGAMFSPETTAQGAFVGKFAGGGKHMIFDASTIEDEFDWDAADNVSFDPKLSVPKLDIKVVGYSPEDKTEMTVGGEERDTTTTTDNGTADKTSVTDSGDIEIEIDTSGIDGDVATENSDTTSSPTEDTSPAPEDDSSFGGLADNPDLRDDHLSFSDGTDIRNYAPRFDNAKAILFPKNPAAQAFGASPERIGQYE